MAHRFSASRVWGAPQQVYKDNIFERKVSWLELFYDLVYVIAISRITHYFSEHTNFSGFLDYTYMFLLIFWGWLNGSMYHDYTGNNGIRSRFITLWQMLFVAALVVCFSSAPEKVMFRSTIALMAIQLYVIYFWFSLNFYGRSTKAANKIYSVCYITAFLLEGSTLFFINQPEYRLLVRCIFYASLFFNYIAPFLAIRYLENVNNEFNLSPSMMERLGLLVTIVFGEVVLSVINGISEFENLDFHVWILFGLGMFITFILWWIFFDLIANQESQKGFLKMTLTEYSFIPALMILGMIAVSFINIFEALHHEKLSEIAENEHNFGFLISGFLLSVVVISSFLNYEKEDKMPLQRLRLVVVAVAVCIFAITFFIDGWDVTNYFLLILGFLLIIVVFIVRNWVVYGEIQAQKIE